ncbi:MAG: RloB domain-containing protein [Ktedonobacteraceae bacterium]
MTQRAGKRRNVRSTLLIVGEGQAEVVFVKHLKLIYRASLGRAVQTRNANGKGARHVLHYAIRVKRYESFDKVTVVLDNDVDWDKHDRSEAARNNIGVVESSPCLEAWLLQIVGASVLATTAEIKHAFRSQFGCEAHDPNYLELSFGRATLDKARGTVPQLQNLMNQMGIRSV